MKKIFKKLMTAFVTAALTVSMMVIPVSASTQPITGGGGGGGTTPATSDMTFKLSVTDTAKADKVFDGGTGLDGLTYANGTLTWDGGNLLSEKTSKDQNKQVKNFVSKVQSANFTTDATNGINDLVSQKSDSATVEMSILLTVYALDQTKGDLVGGMNIIESFLPYINVIIGLIAILLMSLLVLSTVIDLACIGIPTVRDMMFGAGKDGEGGGQGVKKPKVVTYSAWSTIQEVEGGESGKGSGKNAYFVYFKKRIFDYIILGVCVSFLVLGGFSSFVQAFLEIGSQLIG